MEEQNQFVNVAATENPQVKHSEIEPIQQNPMPMPVLPKKLKKMIDDAKFRIQSEPSYVEREPMKMRFQNVAKRHLNPSLDFKSEAPSERKNMSIYSEIDPKLTDKKMQTQHLKMKKSKKQKSNEEFDLVRNHSPQQNQKRVNVQLRRREFSQKVLNERGRTYEKSIVESWKEDQIIKDQLKNPQKYRILCKEVGIPAEEVYKMKNANLNFQLQKFTKAKGLEYLRENQHRIQSTSVNKTRFDDSKHSNLKTIKQIYVNEKQDILNRQKKLPPTYIHQIFGNLKPKKKSQPEKKHIQFKLTPSDRKLLKYHQLNQREEMLGKIVFQRVKKHLQEEKKRPNYITRVKSQENIDDALINYIKTKIERADTILK